MASTQGETKLIERQLKGDLVYYKVAHPDRVADLQWIVVQQGSGPFLSIEKAYEEGANLIVDVMAEAAEPDLENMPTMFFGWAYVQVRKLPVKRWYGRKAPTGEITFADF